MDWIPVSERLPDEHDPAEFVLVHWKPEWRGKRLSKATEDESRAGVSDIDVCFIPYFVARHFHQATHWMPLPSPPVETEAPTGKGPTSNPSQP